MSASVAAHAMLKRMSQNDDAICFRAGCCDMSNLTTSLARLLTSLRKAPIEVPIAPHVDITMGVKNAFFPASLSSLLTTLWLRFARSQLRVDPSMPARAPLPSEVSDPIVSIDTYKFMWEHNK